MRLVLGASHVCAAVIVLLLASPAQAQRFLPVPNEKIFEAFNVGPGGTVCEIGAGDGALSVQVARLLGPMGRVYASELGESRVNALQASLKAAGAPEVTVVPAGETNTNFPDGACDAVVMKDVYHHLSDPAGLNTSILRALKTGGRVVVVDFTPPGDEAPRPSDRGKDGMHGVGPATVERELKEAGFETISSTAPADQRWFIVVMAKPSPRTNEESVSFARSAARSLAETIEEANQEA